MPSAVGFLQSLVAVGWGCAALLRLVGWWFRDKQGALLYYPQQPPDSRGNVANPEDHGLPSYEPLDIRTSDGLTLKSYFIHAARPPGRVPLTLIHFHGNAGNIGHRLPLARRLRREVGCNVVLAEYRGYGHSDTPARITEQGLKLDAQAVLDHVRALPYVDPKGVVVYGASLGGAVGIDLASRPGNERKIAALVIENSFTSISDMVDVLFRTLLEQHTTITQRRKGAVRWLFTRCIKPLVLWIGWRSVDIVHQLRVPVLLISGTKDELIPAEQMARLYQGCRSSVKKLEHIPRGTHNETWLRDQYMPALRHFLYEHVVPHTADGAGGAAAEDPARAPPPGADAASAAAAGVGASPNGLGANTTAQHLDLARGTALLRPFVASRRSRSGSGEDGEGAVPHNAGRGAQGTAYI